MVKWEIGYKSKLNNICQYTISEKNKVIEVINLINGKFRTPKISAFYRALDPMNSLYDLRIPKLPLDHSKLDSNS
jgi:hypothetical protein